MKVAILVFNNFLRDGRVEREANSLQNAGYDVQVIALQEDELPEYEVQRGLDVYRIKIATRNWPKNPIVQIIKWLELFWRIFRQHGDADIYHVCDTLPLPVGMLIKRWSKKEVRVLYDAHELEFDKNSDRSTIGKIIRKIEARYIHKVDAMITVSPKIAEAYVEKYGIEKPEIVMNCPYKIKLVKQDLFREKFNIRANQTILLYQGLIKPNRGVEEILGAMHQLSDDFVFVLLGYTIDAGYEAKIEKMCQETPNVFRHPAVDPDELLDYTSSADIGFYLVQPSNRSHKLTLANKYFEYIQCKTPIVCSNLESPKELVLKEGIGEVLENDEPETIKNAVELIMKKGILSYADNMEKAGVRYTWEEQEKVLLRVYGGISTLKTFFEG